MYEVTGRMTVTKKKSFLKVKKVINQVIVL